MQSTVPQLEHTASHIRQRQQNNKFLTFQETTYNTYKHKNKNNIIPSRRFFLLAKLC